MKAQFVGRSTGVGLLFQNVNIEYNKEIPS
jgi:hypothetical protein